jgi:hypothetical protein
MLFGAEIDVVVPVWFLVVLLLVVAVAAGIIAVLVWILIRKRNSN